MRRRSGPDAGHLADQGPGPRRHPGRLRLAYRVLGVDCTLVYLDDPAARAVSPDLARPGDVVSLADGFPLLLTSIASLDAVNQRLGTPVPMDRFRPNLVIDGAPAWAEDGWAAIEAGASASASPRPAPAAP